MDTKKMTIDEMFEKIRENSRIPAIEEAIAQAFRELANEKRELMRQAIIEARQNGTNVIKIKKKKLI